MSDASGSHRSCPPRPAAETAPPEVPVAPALPSHVDGGGGAGTGPVAGSHLTPGGWLVVLLAGLSTIGPFSIDMMLPAFPTMESDFGAGTVALQQTISVYMVAFAAMSLVHGPASDALGRRRVIVTGTAAYAAGSVLCALAPTLSWLLVGRVVQGLSAGAGMIVARTVVRDVFQGERAQRALSRITMLFGLAPAVAPVLGGWFLGWTSWRAIFWFLVALGVVLSVSALAWLPETHPRSQRIPMRPRALARALAVVGTDAGVLRLGIAGACNFAALFCYIAAAPAIIVTHLGLGAQDFAVMFVPEVVMLFLGSYLVGRLAGRLSSRVFLTVGFATALVAALAQLLGLWIVGQPALPWAIVGPALTAFGVALVLPVITLELLDLQPTRRGTVSSVQGLLQNGTSALVAGALVPLVSGSMVTLSLAAGALTLTGWLLSAWHDRVHRSPAAAGGH